MVKQSHIEQLINKLCPKGLATCTLEEACEKIYAGGTPSTSHPEYYDGDIPWLRSGEIDFNIITSTERNITQLGFEKSSARKVPAHSVLMAMTGATVAKVAMTEIELTANQSVCALVPSKNLNYRYLYYYLAQNYKNLCDTAQGAMTSFNIGLIKKITIALPPLDIQKDIAQKLDTFTNLIDNIESEITERNIQLSQIRFELINSIEQSAKKVAIEKVCVNCYPGATPSTSKKEYWENGTIPWMSSGEVHQGNVTHTEKYITELGYKNSSTKWVPIDSVVIALAGQGKTRGCVALTKIELCTNQSLCALVPNKEKILPVYLYQYLKTQYMNLRNVSSGDGTRGGLNLTMIKAYPIPLPSLKEQQAIAEKLDTIEAFIANLNEERTLRQQQYEYYRAKLISLLK